MRQLSVFIPIESHDCPYLPNRQANSQYIDPRAELSGQDLSELSRLGFRRSGRLVYRPACNTCSECRSIRLVLSAWSPSRNLKRLLKRARLWELSVQSPNDSDEYYALYERYINERHADGDMFPPSRATFREFLTEHYGNTRFLCARYRGELIGVLAFDLFDDGLSAMYCFYAPELESHSVGTVMICRLNQLAAGLNLPYNYLGYLVDGCRKMEYKRRFRPLETIKSGRWQWLD